MFYSLAKQFLGESRSTVVSAGTAATACIVVSMEIPFAAQNAHTHIHTCTVAAGM